MTETPNTAQTSVDLNQLKIKSSALKSSFPLIFSLLCLIGAGGGALLQIASEKEGNSLSARTSQSTAKPQASNKNQTRPPAAKLQSKPRKPAFQAPAVGGDQSVQFGDLDYPVTNKICNQKETFCIYNLADLILEIKDEAFYIFSDTFPKEGLVNINGFIRVFETEQQGNTKLFTFRWQDDQETTTDGFAAVGVFRLEKDPDPAKKGILTKFKATKSFGSKTPVGVENTSYLFPR